MREQALDLRKSARILRRHLIAVGVFVVLGVLAGVGATLSHPPMAASQALVDVVLPPSEQGAAVQAGLTTVNPVLATQIVIAQSNPVLRNVLRSVHLPESLETLQSRVQVTSLASSDVLSIQAEGTTAGQAEAIANAVARSYIAFSQKSQSAQVQAWSLEQATAATTPSLASRLVIAGGLGALVGALVGAIAVLAFNRKDQRLRQRDEIADSIGVPVLASIRVAHPSGAAGWTRLLAGYEPAAVDAWRLRKALQHLGLAEMNIGSSRSGSDSSLDVLCFDFDSGALALGPQLAVFAASRGMPTVLVVEPQPDVTAAATLRAACAGWAAPPSRSKPLQVVVRDHDGDDIRPPDAALTVVVEVVDGQHPHVQETARATAAVLGVSAGAATAEQVARLAAAAAAAGRDIIGILVADPDPDDATTGRLPQLARPAHHKGPTRITGTTVETRR